MLGNEDCLDVCPMRDGAMVGGEVARRAALGLGQTVRRADLWERHGVNRRPNSCRNKYYRITYQLKVVHLSVIFIGCHENLRSGTWSGTAQIACADFRGNSGSPVIFYARCRASSLGAPD